MAKTTNRGAIEEIGKAAELLQKAAQPVINLMFAIIPIVINSMTTVCKLYKKLPTCILKDFVLPTNVPCRMCI